MNSQRRFVIRDGNVSSSMSSYGVCNGNDLLGSLAPKTPPPTIRSTECGELYNIVEGVAMIAQR